MPEAAAPVVTPSAPADPNAPSPTATPSSGHQPTPADPNAPAAPAQAADYWAKEFAGPDGKLNHGAFDKAPDDLKPLKDSLGRYATLDDMLKGMAEREKLLGKKGLFEPLPGNATEAQKKERYDLLRKVNGTPDKPDGFGFQRPQDLPEQYWDQEFATEVQKVMQEEAVSPSAAKRLFEINLKQTQSAIKAQQDGERQWYESQDKLARDVAAKEGMPFEKTMEWAAAAGRRFGISPENPIMKNASALLALARVGKLIGESDLVTGDANDFRVAANMAPEAAQKEASSIQTDKNHPLYAAYWNRDGKHSEDEVKKARETQQKYSRIAYQNRARSR